MAHPSGQGTPSRKRLQLVWKAPSADEAFTYVPLVVTRAPLKSGPKVLYCLLLSYAAENHWEASLPQLAHDCNDSQQTVQHWLDQLKSMGWLKLERQSSKSYRYELHGPK